MAISEVSAQLSSFEQDFTPLTTTIDSGTEQIAGEALAMQREKFTQTVSLEYTGAGLPGQGFSIDDYMGRYYELDSRAQANNTGIFSDQTQGITYVGPK